MLDFDFTPEASSANVFPPPIQSSSLTDSISEKIHARALTLAKNYKRAEAELIDLLQELEANGIHFKRGHSSIFRYVVSELGLAENIAYTLITVSRKATEVPQLKAHIADGTLSLSNARRITPVLNTENQEEWITKAKDLSNRQLEKEIVKVLPKEKTKERASYTSPERVELKVGLSEREMLKLRRVQDLLCQSRRRNVSLEETIETLTREYLKREDPIEKAKRHQVRKGNGAQKLENDPSSLDPKLDPKLESKMKPKVEIARDHIKPAADVKTHPSLTDTINKLVTLRVVDPKIQAASKRRHLPARVKHTVNHRDARRCTHISPSGKRCEETRWIEIHHRIPVSRGGPNIPENLTTLCSAHHRFAHHQSTRKIQPFK